MDKAPPAAPGVLWLAFERETWNSLRSQILFTYSEDACCIPQPLHAVVLRSLVAPNLLSSITILLPSPSGQSCLVCECWAYSRDYMSSRPYSTHLSDPASL